MSKKHKSRSLRVLDVLLELIDNHPITPLGDGDERETWDDRLECYVSRYVPIDQRTLAVQFQGLSCNDMAGLITIAEFLLPSVDLIVCVNEYDEPWVYEKTDDWRYVSGASAKFVDIQNYRKRPPQVDQEPYLYYDPENGDTWTQEAIDDGLRPPDGLISLYTNQKQAPLTDEQIDGIIRDLDPPWLDTPTGFEEEFCRAIERAHGIGGEA